MPPATSRAPKVRAYDEDTATTALLTAKPSSAPTSTGRRGSPRSRAVSGIAAAKDASAYPVTRKPIRASETPRSGAMRGSRPAGSSSVSTAVKAAVDRARSPDHGSGADAGGAVPLAGQVVDMRPCSDLHISVKARATREYVMRIGELSRRTGVPTRLLRYYEEQGLLHPERTDNGYRAFGEAAVRDVQQIRGLLDSGLTTEMIRAILPYLSGPEEILLPPEHLTPRTAALLEAHVDRIQARIDCLARNRDRLSAYLAAVRAEAGRP